MAKKSHSDRSLDVRVLERKIAKGVVGEKEVQKYLKDLPDLADACEAVDLTEPDESGNGEDQEQPTLQVAPEVHPS